MDTIGFLGTNKTDHVFGMYRSGGSRSLVYTFDISGAEDLKLDMDWACSGDMADKNTSVSCSIDGGPPQTVFEVGTSSENWNEILDNGTVLDRNRNAAVLTNGVAARQVTDAFQTYEVSVDGVGALLTVQIIMDSTVGGFGGFGLDNLIVSGVVPVTDGYDQWMMDLGLNGTNATRSANPDDDLYTNEEEYIAGLNPTIPERFEMVGTVVDQSLTLQWNAVEGRVYQVYWSSNLVDGFTLVASNLVDGVFPGGTAGLDGPGFYKVSVGLAS